MTIKVLFETNSGFEQSQNCITNQNVRNHSATVLQSLVFGLLVGLDYAPLFFLNQLQQLADLVLLNHNVDHLRSTQFHELLQFSLIVISYPTHLESIFLGIIVIDLPQIVLVPRPELFLCYQLVCSLLILKIPLSCLVVVFRIGSNCIQKLLL
jgi:hypothetical protein